jgi:hypothetical protein
MSGVPTLVDRILTELQGKSARKLEQYLLGQLSETERAKIEHDLISNEDQFFKVLAAEDDLIGRYIKGTLPSGVRARLKFLTETEPVWKKKVLFAQSVDALAGNERPGALSSEISDAKTSRPKPPAAPVSAGRRPARMTHLGDSPDQEEFYLMAGRILEREPSREVDPASLANEVYRQFSEQLPPELPIDRCLVARQVVHATRRVLVDNARSRVVERGAKPLSGDVPGEETLVILDTALEKLGQVDRLQSQIIELQFFGGLTVEEIAKALGVSKRWVVRSGNEARVWLHAYLGPASQHFR